MSIDDVECRARHARAVAGPGCIADQRITTFDPTKAVRFDMFAAGAVVYPQNAMIRGDGPDGSFVDGIPVASDTWLPIKSVGVMRTTGQSTFLMYLDNSAGVTTMLIDDLIAVQDTPNPAAKAGALLVGEYDDAVSVQDATADDAVYTPLPIDYATQVPLYVELVVTPTDVVDHIEYIDEVENNWGAIVHFKVGASSPRVELNWKTVVFDRYIADTERPTVYAAISDPSQWLSATPVIDASYPAIANAAATLPGHDGAPLEQMQATLDFTSTWITNPTTITGLDATTAYNTKDGSCTGFANLSAAIARSLALPARHVVNILVGDTQDMHSIDEFYLGAALGWRRAEPQTTADSVPEDYGLVVRLVLPDQDEGAAALPTRFNILGGAPLHEFTEPVTPTTNIQPLSPNRFVDCPECPSRADYQANLREDPSAIATTFAAARTRWGTDRAKYLAGGLDAATMTARRAFLGARSLADVQAILATLPQ